MIYITLDQKHTLCQILNYFSETISAQNFHIHHFWVFRFKIWKKHEDFWKWYYHNTKFFNVLSLQVDCCCLFEKEVDCFKTLNKNLCIHTFCYVYNCFYIFIYFLIRFRGLFMFSIFFFWYILITFWKPNY